MSWLPKEMTMTLKQHLQNINAKSKAEMAKTPGLWIGLITEDLDHWASYGVTTPAELDRYFLETDAYEMHKEAFGVKGRHYDFKNMTDQELKDEFESLAKIAKEEQEREAKQEAENYKNFEKRIFDTAQMGAGDRETAIKWILEAEGLEDEKDAGYICYCLGLGYDKQFMFEERTIQ